LGIGLILPALFVWAYISTPVFPHDTLVSDRQIDEPLPKIIKQIHDPKYKVNLRVGEQKRLFQLEFIVLEPFESPSTMLYVMRKASTDVNDHAWVGNVGTKGVYRYLIPGFLPPKGAILYDAIKQEVLAQIDFDALKQEVPNKTK